MKVRFDIFIENLTVFLLPKNSRKYSHTLKLVYFAMTLALQDDHLFAGAWAACGETSYSHRADFERNRLKKERKATLYFMFAE